MRELTHNEGVVGPVAAVVQAAVGLEQDEAAGPVVVIGGDAGHPQTLPLSQQLLLPREAPVVRAGLRSGEVKVREGLFRAGKQETLPQEITERIAIQRLIFSLFRRNSFCS